jgi:virginiamycin A acetyltransferase
MSNRDWLKAAARALATVLAIPWLLSFRMRALLMGSNRALEGSTQTLALLPGLTGQYVRRAFLMSTLDYCDSSATIEFGTVFSQAGARIDANVYIGPHCHIGLVHLERDVLVGPGVHIPSGARTHGTGEPGLPIRDQEQARARVRVGTGTWIGSAAVVMADVGHHADIGAGAVVTKPMEDRVVAGGVPARVIKRRLENG